MKKLKDFVKSQLDEEFKPLKGPLLVVCHFRIPAAKFASPARRKLMHCKPHWKRPDGDNLEKFLNDSLNGIIWQDDAQIAWMLRSKTMTVDKIGEIILFVTELEALKTNCDEILLNISEQIKLEEI